MAAPETPIKQRRPVEDASTPDRPDGFKRLRRIKVKTSPQKSSHKSSDAEVRDAIVFSDDEVPMQLMKRPAAAASTSPPPKRSKRRAPPQPFLDPAGISPGDLSAENIVFEQVRKVGDLLKGAIKAGDWPKGVVRLATACSGTDSPVLAGRLQEEALQKLDQIGLLAWNHVMSCEIEPFKQAYIARNFPAAKLFPDITKLTPENVDQGVQTVYGGLTDVPKCEFFIAGTVCKDFSMRKTKFRLDLEDKGKSGQTFFGACDYIFRNRPRVSIFENVLHSPWAKMVEYITGMVPLSSALTTGMNTGQKVVKSTKTGEGSAEELLFHVTKEGQLLVVGVPRHVGVRPEAKLTHWRNAKGERKPVRLREKTGLELSLAEVQSRLGLKEDDVLEFDTAQEGFHAHWIKVDSKEYGLPQTRQRGYMLVWHDDLGGKEIGECWEEVVRFLRVPLRYSLPSFLLPDDDERVRRFREVLRGPAGLQAQRHTAEWFNGDWWNSKSKDADRNKQYRKDHKLELESRPTTGWDKNGRCCHQPTLWPEQIGVFDSRQRDLVDCFTMECAQEDPPRDPLHSSYVWDVSQNVGITGPCNRPGVCGCITPGGWLFLPDQGRCILGFEKLLLQGIPAGRILLGQESEVQLSDLAGNAMSLPVVHACMLSALVAREVLRRRQRRSGSSLEAMIAATAFRQQLQLSAAPVEPAPSLKDAAAAQDAMAALVKMAAAAEATSALCLCETSGSVCSAEVLSCQDCGLSVCRDCAACLSLGRKHRLGARCLAVPRPSSPAGVEHALRCSAPAKLKLQGATWELLREAVEDDAVSGLEDISFTASQVKRRQGHWTLRYLAFAEGAATRPLAELSLHVGSLGCGFRKRGLRAELRTFGRAHKDKGGRSTVAARLLWSEEALQQQVPPRWQVRNRSPPLELVMQGNGMEPSYRAELGLEEYSSEKWPKRIDVSINPTGRNYESAVVGQYERLRCRGTAVQGALWRRRETSNADVSSFLLISPDPDRTGPDAFLISESPSYHEADGFERAAIASEWAPECALLGSHASSRATLVAWKPASKLTLVAVPSPLRCDASEREPVSELQAGAGRALHVASILGASEACVRQLLAAPGRGGRGSSAKSSELHLVGPDSGVRARRFADSFATLLLKEGVPKACSEWQELKQPLKKWGECPNCCPLKPDDKWEDGVRSCDPEEANGFEVAVRSRPTAWRVHAVPDGEGGRISIEAQPAAAAHRAAAALPSPPPGAAGSRGAAGQQRPTVQCSWRITGASQTLEPAPGRFSVPNSDAFEEADTPSLFLPEFQLYPRQRRALWRMLQTEGHAVPFEERERSEHPLPGIGWWLEAEASQKRPLPGGLLADELGGGKTATAIALVAQDRDNARALRAEFAQSKRDCDGLQASATLVLAPPSLLHQWDEERKKFTGDALKTQVIPDAEALNSLSVEDIRNADLVIASCELLESEKYLQNLRKKSEFPGLPQFPGTAGHTEPECLKGVWTPAHPSQPHGTAKGNQQKRDKAAFFSSKYQEAVQKLRRLGGVKDEAMGPPLELFRWHRIVVDELHQAFATGESKKLQRASREFLGVGVLDVESRPLRARRGVWGLTGTPMLSSEQRVTELAALCGGVSVMGAARHWRSLEKASVRDQFLLACEPALSTQYRAECRKHAQEYLLAAAQRNRVDTFHQKQLTEEVVKGVLDKATSAAFQECLKGTGEAGTFAPEATGVPAMVWEQLLDLMATAPARSEALRRVLDRIHSEDKKTKVVVFSTSAASEAARKALSASGVAFSDIGGLAGFAQPDVTAEDEQRPRVLLLTFEQAVGLNLQYACHHVVLFAPAYDPDVVSACAQEQQAIGRVHRFGQAEDVTVFRIILDGPRHVDSIDATLLRRNTAAEVVAATTSA